MHKRAQHGNHKKRYYTLDNYNSSRSLSEKLFIAPNRWNTSGVCDVVQLLQPATAADKTCSPSASLMTSSR